jgi:predicted membrane-bound dolichyl-phosphate-mannose-protein mannosyltransferase
VNVARIILGLPHESDVYPGAPAGIDPNHEHPPLAKGIIALSMFLIGDNGWGWRIPSVIFGMISILVFYLLVKKISKNDLLSFMSVFLFTFDNLVFVHSRIATLDIFMFAFMLLGFYFYFSDKPVLSALSLALSTLCKIGGLYGFMTLVVFHFTKEFFKKRPIGEKIDWQKNLGWLEKTILVYGISGIALLTIMDRLWGGYNNPFDHITFIYNYTKGLTRLVPEGIESYPWQWLLNEVKIPYLTVNVNTLTDSVVTGSYTSVAFVGAMNPLIIYLCIPTIAYTGYEYYNKRDDLTLFALLWFICTYLPFYPMSIIGHRIMYIFYFLSTLPSICIAVPYMIIDQKPPRMIVVIYFAAVIGGFISLFPFRVVP